MLRAAHFSESGRPPAGQAGIAAPLEPPSRQLFEQAFELHQRGELDAAQAAYQALLARNEQDPRVHNNLGLLYRQRGQHELAIRELRRALMLNPHYLAARSNLGVALLGASRIDDAAAEIRRVLEEDPRSVDAMVNLALAEQRAGRPERAKEVLLRALGLDPRSAPAHFNLAALYDESGDAGLAVAHYRDFLREAGLEHPHSSAARHRIASLGASR
jgi:tetratricopeptide (TPR) repeat protein